jgi:3'-5' exonuclease
MARDQTAYIVFDIETVPDGKLVADVLYPHQNLSEDDAIALQEKEVEEQSGGRSTFVPAPFHLPVAVGVARVAADFRLQKVALLDAPEFRCRRMVELFWRGLDSYPEAMLVDFGGRTFDMPVLELAAFRYGISLPFYFGSQGRGYRHRYGDRHLDLLDWITNWGACRLRGGLDLLAKLLGKPGKMEVKGEDVLRLWREGKKDRIGSYCLCDVLDTYFVFLRTRLLTGEITAEGEREIAEHARGVIEDLAFEDTAVEEYLSRWRPPSAEKGEA